MFQSAVVQQVAADIIKPEALTEVVQQLCGFHNEPVTTTTFLESFCEFVFIGFILTCDTTVEPKPSPKTAACPLVITGDALNEPPPNQYPVECGAEPRH